MSVLDDLNQMEKEVEQAREKIARKKGQIEEQMRRLVSWGYTTVEIAEKEALKLEKACDKKLLEIEGKFKRLKESYDWRNLD